MAGFLVAAGICCFGTFMYELTRGVIAQRSGNDSYREHYRLAAGGSWLVLILFALALIARGLGAKYF